MKELLFRSANEIRKSQPKLTKEEAQKLVNEAYKEKHNKKVSNLRAQLFMD